MSPLFISPIAMGRRPIAISDEFFERTLKGCRVRSTGGCSFSTCHSKTTHTGGVMGMRAQAAAPSSLQIGHHQAVVSPVRDECCAGAAGRSPRRTDSKEQQHEPAAWMSRRLVSTAVLTSGMTASARVSEGINRAGYPVREPTRATLVSATWPGGGFVQLCVGRVSGRTKK